MEKGKTDVFLTADRTLMSNYHHNEFLGFGTCAPQTLFPPGSLATYSSHP